MNLKIKTKTQNKPLDLTIYTDGSCLENPGPGGYAFITQCNETDRQREISVGFRYTTNNRMELMAVIVALERVQVDHSKITVFSDSKYVVDGVNNWLGGWASKRFAGIKNPDLWKRLHSVLKRQNVTLKWIKGHAGNEYNEMVDDLARQAALGSSGVYIDFYSESRHKNKLI